MGKIKKIYKITAYILFSLLIITASAFMILRNPGVQTRMAQKFLSRYSERIKGEITFEKMKLTFFNTVHFENILILDESSDTLLFAPVFNAGLRYFERKTRSIRVGRIYLGDPVIGIRPDSSGKLNVAYFSDLLSSKSVDTTRKKSDLSINQVKIINGRLSAILDTGSAGSLRNFSFKNINITVDDLRKRGSDLDLTLSELSFDTGGEFRATSIFTEIDISDDHIYLVDPTIRTSGSFINSDLIGIDLIGRDSMFNFIEDARLRLNFNRSLISLADIGYFVDSFKDSDETIILSGSLNGTMSELKGRKIELEYSDSTRLLCDFDLSGLPDIENTFMFVNVEELSTSAAEIESIKIPGYGYINLGDELRRLGSLSFKGNFTGFTTDFVTYGIFNSDLGSISTDILFRPDTAGTFIYKGSLRASAFNAGKLADMEDMLGVISFSAEVDGSSRSFDRFNAFFDGTVDSLELNGYTYRDIRLRGNATENIWDGAVESSSQDLKMDLLGRFDFSGDKPEFDFTLNLLDADLHALNIDSETPDSRLSMLLTANFSGNNIDNIDGEIRLLNSRLTRDGESFDLYDASLKTGQEGDTYNIAFRSDFVDADIEGKYDLRSVIDDITTAAERLAPSLFRKEDALYRISNNNFAYDIRFKNSDPVNDFFKTGFKLAPGSTIGGKVDPDSMITLVARGDYLMYNDYSLTRFNLDALVRDSAMNITLESQNLNLLNRIDLKSFTVTGETAKGDFNTAIKWDNPGTERNSGELAASGSLSSLGGDKSRLNVNIRETSFYVRDQQWLIHPSIFMVDSTSISFDKFLVSHNEDFLSIDGKVSGNSEDSLEVSLKNLRLDALNDISRNKPDAANKIEFLVGGSVDGRIMLYDIYNNFLFESNILVSDFTTNEHRYGDVRMTSVWNSLDRVAEISLENDISGTNTFGIDGTYNPESKEIDFTTRVDRFPMDVLNLVLKSFANGVKGYASGQVNISGSTKSPLILGSVMAEDASITVDYLKTPFNFSDSVIFDRRGFTFRDIAISDGKGNNAVLNGFVSHRTFKDFEVGLRINADNILALDTRQKDNVLFYGTAYGSGVVSITGPTNSLKLDVSARTGRNTRLFIPLNAGAEISDYSFISFASYDTVNKPERVFNIPMVNEEKKSSIELNFDLEVTPDAEVQLVFDSKVGDIMRGRGTGDLNLSLSRDGEFSIFGDYVIEDGDYLFTLGNIFNKKFVVENGGTISWDGDVNDANVNIKAIYKLRTSLFDLLQDEAFSQRIPVDCHLNMSGKLINPVIGFDIYLPTADEQTRTYVRNAINTEEEMSRQFLYLLVMNSFYPSASYASAVNTSSAGASAMGVTTTEMLSNQLSNWLSQISNDFDIGFAYRPGNEVSSQEVEVALSTQLLNDRVIINGNVDVGGQGSTSSANNISGDFDVEVKLTEKVRFKVFNRSNDNLYYETAPYTQGLGLFYRQDFNRFSDIFKRDRAEAKKEDEPEVSNLPPGNHK